MSFKRGSLLVSLAFLMAFSLIYTSLAYFNAKISSRREIPFNLSLGYREYRREAGEEKTFDDLVNPLEDRKISLISSTDRERVYGLYDPNFEHAESFISDFYGLQNSRGAYFSLEDYINKKDLSIRLSRHPVNSSEDPEIEGVKMEISKGAPLYRDDVDLYLNLAAYGKLGDTIFLDSYDEEALVSFDKRIKDLGYKDVTPNKNSYAYLLEAYYRSGRAFSLYTPALAVYLFLAIGVYNLNLYNRDRIILRLSSKKTALQVYLLENRYILLLAVLGALPAYLVYLYNNKYVLSFISDLSFFISLYAGHFLAILLISSLSFVLVMRKIRKENYRIGGADYGN